MDFDVKPYKTSGTYVVGGIDDIITLLDDQMVKTQTMRQSVYIGAIEKDARMWEKQLRYAQALIEEWITCQKAWMYLEPIFSSDDIMAASDGGAALQRCRQDMEEDFGRNQRRPKLSRPG